ncbi:MAG TPA: V-type ATP synthase subunit D [Gaiellaceae bacterium]|nr:V-type ATP synthase subunit D [Gaiellaceae bacterium]
MPLRVPPGRTGRPWLLHRLEVARAGADVLEEKRRALLRRRDRLAPEVVKAEREWERLAREAVASHQEALVLSGARRLRLAAFYGGGRADVRVRYRNLLGVTLPDPAEIDFSEPVDLVPLGVSLPLALAAGAHRQALEAAARYASVREAHRRVSEETRSTARRLRAIEQRWIPRHEEALARLELMLDELEREDSGRVRWFQGRSAN